VRDAIREEQRIFFEPMMNGTKAKPRDVRHGQPRPGRFEIASILSAAF
jgi:hypothetical protein